MTQINTQINPQFKQYQQQSTGAGIAPLQNVDAEKIQQGINNSTVLKASDGDNMGVKVGLTGVIGIGMVKLMSAFSHACKGDYKDSLVGKVGTWGDETAKKPVVNNGFVSGVSNAASKTKTFIKTKIIDKSRTLSAFFNTPSKPTSESVLTMMHGTSADIANDAIKVVEDAVKHHGKTYEAFGFASKAEFEAIKKNPVGKESTNKIIEAFGKSNLLNESLNLNVKEIPLVGKEITIPKKLARTVSISEIRNKLLAMKGLENPEQLTRLGKTLPRGMVRGLEILTNGNAGGKFAMFFQAYFVAEAIVAGYKAQKGEKGKTFAESLIYNLGWFATMPIALKTMHAFGGLQYTGISKVRVAKYRKAHEAHNKKADLGIGAEGGFASKEEQKASKQAIKDMINGKADKAARAKLNAELKAAGRTLKVGNKSVRWYHQPFRVAANILTVGLEGFKGAVNASDSKFIKAMKNRNFHLKNAAGYPVRFIMFMAVIAPFFAKLAAKGSHVIFGKPSKSVLDEEKPPEGPQAAAQAAIQSRPQATAIPQAGMPNAVAPATTSSNLLHNYQPTAPTSVVGQPQVNVQPQTAPAPSAPAQAPPVAPQAPQAPVRTYVPSSAGVVIQPQQNQQGQPQGLDKASLAMNRADFAEKEALKFIHE